MGLGADGPGSLSWFKGAKPIKAEIDPREPSPNESTRFVFGSDLCRSRLQTASKCDLSVPVLARSGVLVTWWFRARSSR